MDDELIKFRNVKKRFGKNTVLESISFDVPEKKITGIIGASGEGKTTMLKLLVGFYKPTSGEIMYSKRNINKDMKNIKKIFGFSTEDGSFHERLTVSENMKHFGSLHKIKIKNVNKKINELLTFVGLDQASKTFAGNLSMGMKKRLDVAISLMHDPEILIMDEPTADLDPLLRDHMLKLIRKIRDRGTTVILTTQMLSEMDKICDKIVILFDKNIVEQGTPDKIKKKYNSSDLDGVFTKIFSQRNSKKSKSNKVDVASKVSSEKKKKAKLKKSEASKDEKKTDDFKDKNEKFKENNFEGDVDKIKSDVVNGENSDEIKEDKEQDFEKANFRDEKKLDLDDEKVEDKVGGEND